VKTVEDVGISGGIVAEYPVGYSSTLQYAGLRSKRAGPDLPLTYSLDQLFACPTITVEIKDKLFSEKYKRDFGDFKKEVAEKISLMGEGKIDSVRAGSWEELEYALEKTKGKLDYSLVTDGYAFTLGKDPFPYWFSPDQSEAHEKEFFRLLDRVEAHGNPDLREKLFESMHLLYESRENRIKLDGLPDGYDVCFHKGISNTSEGSPWKGVLFTALGILNATLASYLSGMIRPAYAANSKIPRIDSNKIDLKKPLTQEEKKLFLELKYTNPQISDRWVEAFYAHDDKDLICISRTPFNLWGLDTAYNQGICTLGDTSTTVKADNKPNLDDLLVRVNVFGELPAVVPVSKVVPLGTDVCYTIGDGDAWVRPMQKIPLSADAYVDMSGPQAVLTHILRYPLNGDHANNIKSLILAGNNTGYWRITGGVGLKAGWPNPGIAAVGRLDDVSTWEKAYPEGLHLAEFNPQYIPFVIASAFGFTMMLKRRKHAR